MCPKDGQFLCHNEESAVLNGFDGFWGAIQLGFLFKKNNIFEVKGGLKPVVVGDV